MWAGSPNPHHNSFKFNHILHRNGLEKVMG